MENATDNEVNALLHVICVPFRICSEPDAKICLSSTAEIIKKSAWQPVDNQHLHKVPSEKWRKPQQYQMRAYFHPFVQRFLFDSNRVRRFIREDIDALEVDFFEYNHEKKSTDRKTIELDVNRCELTLFQPDIGVLILEVSPKLPMCLRDTQSLLDTLRRLYPPYLAQYGDEPWKSGHCPGEVRLLKSKHSVGASTAGLYRGDSTGNDLPTFFEPYFEAFWPKDASRKSHAPCADHWSKLLEPFKTTNTSPGALIARQFGDDRAPTMSYLAIKNPRQISRGDWMRLCFSDEPGNNTLPYAAKFMPDFERSYCYDRYWYGTKDSSLTPSRILNCGYSFAWVGACEDTGYFTDRNNGAIPTFSNIYVTMGLIAHFQRASLLAASERLTEMVLRDGDKLTIPDRGKVREFYEQFLEFTQHFWFDEISPQEQGQQLFQMWRKHLRIQELYDEVRQELKDLVDYSELRASSELNQKVGIYGLVAVILAVVSAVAGIFGMNPPGQWELEKWIGFSAWMEQTSWPVLRLSTISIPLLLVVLLTALWGIYKIWRKQS